LKITKANYSAIEEFTHSMYERGTSVVMRRKVLTTLGSLLSYAVKKRYLEHNTVKDFKRPKDQSEYKADTVKFLTPQQAKAPVDAEKDLKYKALYMTALVIGARQGELLGLKWADIDWQEGLISIERTFNHGQWYIPKTKYSRRKVHMPPALVSQLRLWQEHCPFKILVFPNRNSKPLNAQNVVRRRFIPTRRPQDAPGYNFTICGTRTLPG
jgi:integrase